MDIKLFNTLGREKQVFTPIEPGKAGMYTCGPTVYNFQHIGNFRTFLFEDFLKRVLLYNGYDVKHIMNITDVGHLVSDDDEGEDKMETGAAREGKSAMEIAEYYTQFFYDDSNALNIIPPFKYTKATEYINEQIEMVKCLEAKGYTYITSDGVYFDTSKLSDYGKLARLDVKGLEEGKRIEFSAEKKNITDFAIWKFSPKDQQRQLEWDSPWGKGFPGWHLECSAMSKKYLGDTFDIHCGGIDHVPIHHTNEIAQSEACNGQEFVHYWLHGAFLEDETGKMSKSSGDFLRLKLLIDKGYSPLDYRYMCLGTHYRKRLIFNWEILDSAKTALGRLRNKVIEFKSISKSADTDSTDFTESMELAREHKEKFLTAVNDDLNMSEALAVIWGVTKEEKLTQADKLALMYDFDRVLGLDLEKSEPKKESDVPEEIMSLVQQRTEAKKAKNFKLADELREKAKEMGFNIIDKKDKSQPIKMPYEIEGGYKIGESDVIIEWDTSLRTFKIQWKENKSINCIFYNGVDENNEKYKECTMDGEKREMATLAFSKGSYNEGLYVDVDGNKRKIKRKYIF